MPRYRVYICGDSPALRESDCPNVSAHSDDEPAGYVEWHEWAEEKAKTHDQSKCDACGLYAIWTAR